MRKAPLLVLLFTVITFCNGVATAQLRTGNLLDSIVKKIDYYGRRQPLELMFVHLDKTIYTGNESVWFTAYILNCPPAELSRHQVLSAALISDGDNTVTIADKFISAGRIAFGNLTLPDTIAPGNYTFIAYTNRKVNGKPAAFFAQPITIKAGVQPQFDVVARVDTFAKDPAGVHVILRGTKQSGALVGASVSYAMGINKRTRVNGKGKTNANGDYELIIPRDRITPNQHILNINVKQGDETKTLKLFMPLPRTAHHINFYPEGGYLIAGLINQVAWEAKNAGGAPLKATATLWADKKVIDTISTDSYGMGTFSLQASPNVKYQVKLLSPQNVDTIYRLPAAVQKGVIMHIPNALANDTLRFAINALQPQTIYLMVQNYNQVYATVPVQLAAGRRSVKVDLNHVPRGLNSITLLDSLHRPFAERMFFAHYQQKNNISISTNSQEYGLRKKVNLSLRLKSKDGQPVQGIVSVSCAQENRFDLKKDNNIENYVYLRSAIENLPLKENYIGDTNLDRQYLNELLLVRGWSKYKWLDMVKAVAADTLLQTDSLMYSALLKQNEKPLKKPAQLLVMGDSAKVFNILNSNEKGELTIDNVLLAAEYGKKVRMIVSGKSSEYVIKVTDPYAEENKVLAAAHIPGYFGEPPAEIDTRELVLKGMERATHLREVKIVARKDNFIRFGMNANKCGDYVCSYTILNCPNHRFDAANRPPRKGELVGIPGMGRSIYYGCADGELEAGMVAVKGIYQAKEFYGADYSTINPTEPDYLSTICWKHAVAVSSETDTQFSFYTSDITGNYRIVVQGLAGNDVTYGERVITVKKQLP